MLSHVSGFCRLHGQLLFIINLSFFFQSFNHSLSIHSITQKSLITNVHRFGMIILFVCDLIDHRFSLLF